MVPAPRLLWLLLAGILPLAGTSSSSLFVWLTFSYFLLVGGLVVSDLLLTPTPDRIQVTRHHDLRLSLGADNPITIHLINRTNRPITVTVRDEYPDAFPSDTVYLSGTIPPHHTLIARYHVRPLQRGNYRFHDVNVRYQSALKLFVRQARYAATTDVKVYPNILEIRKYELMSRKGLLFEMGLRPTRILGMGGEFERLREYNPDDEFRRINWKATARCGKLIAAEYQTERSQYVLCVIDTGRLMGPPIGDLAKLDYAINAALLLSYVALLKGDHIGLLTFADRVQTYLAPRRGKTQFSQMLEALYHVQAQTVEADHARALSYLSMRHRRRSLIVLFTDLVTADTVQPLIANLIRLARHHLPLCVTMSDPNLTGLARKLVRHADDVYQRAVAEMLLDERQVVLDTLNRNGVLTLDVPADRLTVSIINMYLSLKTRGKL